MANQNVQYILSLKDLFSAKIKEADNEASKLSGTMSGLQSLIAGAFGGYAVSEFVKGVVNAGTKVEDAKTGLTTLLKDANEAQRVISNTMSDATKMPFGFESLLMANKALISADESADNARSAVVDLANAIAATGGGDDELSRMVVNLQQIKNTGVATAMDIKQFAFAGVNLYKVLSEAGIKTGEDSVITYKMITDSLKKAHEEGGIYYNGLENMANNTSVRISNLGDSVFQLKVRMYEDLKPAILVVMDSASKLIDTFGDMWNWLVKNKDEIKSLSVGVAVATGIIIGYNTVLKLTSIYTATVATVTQLYGWYTLATAEGMGVMSAAQFALNAVMSANPIGIVVVALAALAAGIYYAWQKSETFRGTILGVWEILKSLFNFVVQAGSGLGTYLEGIFTLDTDKIKEGAMQVASAWKNLDVSGSYQKGFELGKNIQTGVNDGVKNGVTGVTAVAPTNTTTNVPKAVKTPKASSVTGQKSYNINISINSLVKEFNVSTTNINEGAQKIKDIVTQVMLSAVNDSQIIAER